jgi:hypothetical protein
LSLINRVLVGQAGPIAKTFPPLEKAAIDGNALGSYFESVFGDAGSGLHAEDRH